MDFEKSRLPSIMWVGLTQSIEGLNRTRQTSRSKREFFQQTAFGLELQHKLSWIPTLMAHSADF